MATYVCSICGYTYDEAVGIPEAGIAPGTKYEDLPEDWACPLCGAAKSEFMQQGEPAKASAPARERQEPAAAMEVPADLDGMTALEMSALCSNLARGCEKQYKQEEAALFNELAAYFKNAAAPADGPDPGQLAERIDKDLAEGFPQAFDAASGVRDRGALRALTWSDKVTRIHKSLLARYLKEGDAMLEKADVFVCSICGFVHIGAAAPDLCPVCKVPNWKFEKIEGRS